MTDTPKTTVAVNAAKIGGIATFVPVVLSNLPSPYSWVIASIIIACSAINATVQPPAETSKWRIPYKLVEVMALNLGWALNLFGTRMASSVSPSQDKKS